MVDPPSFASALASDSSFYAGEGVSWSSLGVSEKVTRALRKAEFERPSLVQATCIPQILSGKDVIIAAETGSGKTHGYLVPLFGLHDRQKKANVEDGDHNVSLILCPNVMLCEQVVKMANSLCSDSGEPLLRVSALCGNHGWPDARPDIIVSTPAALLNSLFALGTGRNRRPRFLRKVKYVVFDEADMLLCGSFEHQIVRLINMFRLDEKRLSRMGSSLSENSLNLENESEEKSVIENELPDADEGLDNDPADGADVGDDVVEELRSENRSKERKVNKWRRVKEVYSRSKQYIFVAATLPVNGKKTAGGVLKRMFPDAVLVSGDYLHRHNPRLEQRWIEVTVDSRVDALIDAVKSSFNPRTASSDSQLNRTMVFVNTVDAAEAVSKIFGKLGMECICYHRNSSLEDKMSKLASFQKEGGILVCTDAAARGLDVPNVSHVIQAEFAPSAVDFLHRIGRTARAGQYGVVTSLYTESNRELVYAIQHAEKMGQPVENAFSRKRSFRNKLKKGVLITPKSSPVAETAAA